MQVCVQTLDYVNYRRKLENPWENLILSFVIAKRWEIRSVYFDSLFHSQGYLKKNVSSIGKRDSSNLSFPGFRNPLNEYLKCLALESLI